MNCKILYIVQISQFGASAFCRAHLARGTHDGVGGECFESGEDGVCAKTLFDAEELIVFRDAVGA